MRDISGLIDNLVEISGEFNIPEILKGNPGEPGKPGAPGAPGAPGEPGKDGKDYTITQDDYAAIAAIVMENISIPSKLSQLENDTKFLTRTAENLANYYLKQQTYTRDEIQGLISTVPKFAIKVVSVLPTYGISESTIYLLKSSDTAKNLYTEYIRVNGAWEKLGEQTTTVDLSDYYKKEEADAKFLTEHQDISRKADRDKVYTKEEIDAKENKTKGALSELETEVENHENRISTLERGGGSGYDDTLIRSEISQLSESIDEISVEKYKENFETLTWTDGKYLNYYNGNVMSNIATARMSDYVPVNIGDTIKVYGKTYYDINLVFFFDADKKFITSFPHSTSTEKRYDGEEIPLPSGTKYVIMCYDSSVLPIPPTLLKKAIFTEDTKAQKSIVEINNYLEELTTLEYENVQDVTWEDGYFLGRTNGARTPLTSARTSGFIPIKRGDTVKFNGKVYYDINCLFFFDSDGAFISCFPNTQTSTKTYNGEIVRIPNRATQVRICYDTTSGYPKEPMISTLFPVAKTHEKKEWEGLTWCAIGDSLTENNSKASEKYHKIISEKTGIQILNYGVGGTGYYSMKDSNLAFYQRIANVPTNADVYTIFGSFNDMGVTIGNITDKTSDTLYGCMYLALTALFERNPNAIVGIITPTPWEWTSPYREPRNGDQYVEAVINMANKWSIPVLDLYHCSNLRPWNDACKVAQFGDGDGVHPNNLGNAMIAPKIKVFLDTLLL